jgi:hypothetical protein
MSTMTCSVRHVLLDDEIREGEICGACSERGGNEKCVLNFGSKV